MTASRSTTALREQIDLALTPGAALLETLVGIRGQHHGRRRSRTAGCGDDAG
jgi:hypothetical protein